MPAKIVDSAGPVRAVALVASKTVATAGTVEEAAVTGLGASKQALILLNVTAAATDAGDTFDVYVDTSIDGGTTWLNVIHFTQVLGNGGAKKYWAVLDPGGNPAATVVDGTSDAAAGAVRPSMFGDQLRVRHVLVDADADASITFSVTALLKA